QEREPFAFGRTVGEVAKLVAVGFAATQLAGSNDVPGALRFPAAAVVLLVGAVWALLRIQRRTLDSWLDLAVRYGATPRRRVWLREGVVCLGERTAERCYRAALAVEGPREAFARELERVQPVLDGFAGFLNAIGQPSIVKPAALQILVRAEPGDLSDYATRLE